MAILPAKAEVKAERDKISKLQAFGSSYFPGKSHFEDDGTQSYLVFQPICRYFKTIGNTDHISSWKSKGLIDESIKLLAASNNSLALSLSYVGTKIRERFDGSCLKEDKITFTHGKTVNIYIVYEINVWDHGYDDYPALEKCFFGAVKFVKNVDIDKYKYSAYNFGFDSRETFSIGNRFGKNVIIFGADMCLSVHVDNKKKDISILGEGPTQRLDNTTFNAEKKAFN